MTSPTENDDKLGVYLEGDLTGQIQRHSGNLISFQYDKSWIENGFPITISLPLQQEEFAPEVSTNYFDNLLPETAVRQKIARQKKISERDIFGLLKLLGQDCAGALVIFDAHEQSSREPCYGDISIEELDKIILNLRTRPLGTAENEIRLSLAGAQEKLAIYIENGHFKIPKNGAPSSHIVKPASTEFRSSVFNEYFCMRLADIVGLNVPPCEILTIFSDPVFMIQRFDRYVDGKDQMRRIHQEDFCQALGIEGNRKYESDGGPTFTQCFQVLEEHSTQQVSDQLMLVDWYLFNLLIGNSDAHAKNIALLNSGGRWNLAPFYDIVSTAIYPELTVNMAMGIGGKRDPRYLYFAHFERQANDLNMKINFLKGRTDALTNKIQGALPIVSEELGVFEEGEWVSHEIQILIKSRIRQIRTLLSIDK